MDRNTVFQASLYKPAGQQKAMAVYFSIAIASAMLTLSCAQSRRKYPAEDAAGRDNRDVAKDADRDAGRAQPAADLDAGTLYEQTATEDGDEASEDAGDRTRSNAAGGADGVSGDAKLHLQEAEALIPEFIFQKWPNLNPDVVFEIEMQEIADLWEALNVQIFTVYFFVRDDPWWFRSETLIYHQGELDVLLGTSVADFMSGVVVRGVFYYTHCSGSGILRSHVGKLSMDQGFLAVKESGGFSFQNLFVKASGDVVEVETGLWDSFNSWRDGEFFGTIKDNGDTLTLLDAFGEEIAPDFPPYDSPRRLFDST